VVELGAPPVGVLELADGRQVGDHGREQLGQLVSRRLRALRGADEEVFLRLEQQLDLLGLIRTGAAAGEQRLDEPGRTRDGAR
jgi:hypothetical protein